MLEKLKSWAQAAKQALLYIGLPILSLIGYIAYLLKSNRTLETKLEQAESERDIVKDVVKGELDEKKADDLETEFNHLVDEFNNTTGPGGTKSDT